MASSIRGGCLSTLICLLLVLVLIVSGCDQSQQVAQPDPSSPSVENSQPPAPPPPSFPTSSPSAANSDSGASNTNEYPTQQAGYAQESQRMASVERPTGRDAGNDASYRKRPTPGDSARQTSYETADSMMPPRDPAAAKKEAPPLEPYVRPTGWQPAAGLQVGNVAPEIVGRDLDGKQFRLSEYRGQVVVLDFWADWCPHCRVMYPHEREMVATLEDRPFALLGVNSDQRPQAEAAIAREGITWRSWWDVGSEPPGAIMKQYQVRGIPTIYVIDHQGVICYQNVRGEKLDAAVQYLLPLAESATPEEASELPVFSARALDMREWSDKTGQFSIVAAFVKFEDGKAHLEREEDGKVIEVSMTKLSDEDQQFIRDLLKARKRRR